MDLATVRAEIKRWERNFKSSNGRDPSVQDIKDNQPIADKYKLYKKLCKVAALAPQPKPTHAVDLLSTPPRPAIPPHTSRAVEVAGPLTSFNPFSPAKPNVRQPPSSPTRRPSQNPFATPVKTKAKPRSPSPDLFEPIILSLATGSTSTLPLPDPNTAINRARKRLRGDPVSPSPNKDKRRRVFSQSKSFPSSAANGEDNRGEDNSFLLHNAEEDPLSFLDSPVKPPAGRKSFQVLFDEGNTGPAERQIRAALSRSKTTPGLFGESSKSPALDGEFHNKQAAAKKMFQSKLSFPAARLPPKDDLFSSAEAESTGSNQNPTEEKAASSNLAIKLRASAKRTVADVEMEGHSGGEEDGKDAMPPISRTIQLLRPSPPPTDPYASKYNGKGKEKGKSVASRKKARLADDDAHEDDSEDEDSSDESKIKVIDLFRRTKPLSMGFVTSFPLSDEDPDPDILLGSARPVSIVSKEDEEDGGLFDVDLPENLRHMLALTPSKATLLKEEKVARSVLLGNGGRPQYMEVWGPGEDQHASERTDDDGEDDWEGEGVPWEVGEL